LLSLLLKKGDYLLVGIHGDTLVHKIKGSRFPLQNAYERSLSVLGCRFVDDVLLDAPYEVTSAMIDTLQIKHVIKLGNDGICNKSDTKNDTAPNSSLEIDRFLDPRQAGILEVIENSSGFSIDKVFRRILDDEETFQCKYNRKLQAEQAFLQEKYGKSRDFSETI
jgi:ethanolamine-phosphate cytidylyltransferase